MNARRKRASPALAATGLVLAAAVSACAPPRADKSPPAAAEAVDFNTDLPIKELMNHVVSPAAFGVWNGAGYRMTRKGTEDLAPKTEAGWLVVENGGAGVIEAGNLLLIPARVQGPESAWRGYAKRLTEAGIAAKAAAEAHDENAVFAAGTRIDEACTACHAQFMPGGEGGPPPAK